MGFLVKFETQVQVFMVGDLQERSEVLTSREVLDRHLDGLVRLDPRLKPVLKEVGEVPLRKGKPGFSGLALIVSSQLLSVASARAIYSRVEALVGEMSGHRFLFTEETELRKAGLSRSKIDCLRSIGRAEQAGELDFEALHAMAPDKAMDILTSFRGIGRWSAEIYLMSCVAHPDVFPAGDLVLQKMVGKIASRRKKPDEKTTRRLARKWSPYRGSAARLLWRYFAVLKNREGINL